METRPGLREPKSELGSPSSCMDSTPQRRRWRPSLPTIVWRPVSEMDDTPPMVKKLFWTFIGTLFLYVTIYGGCQAMRVRGGPWNVTYAFGEAGVPELRIEHPRLLGPVPVVLRFPGEKPSRADLPITVVFSAPITNAMPFGAVIFVDTTQLPGTVTLNCFGHIVEMVPRTLFVDLKEVPWTAATNIVLSAATKPDPAKLKTQGQAWRGR